MTYVLKKLISGMLQPLSLTLCLLLIGWFLLGLTQRKKSGGLLLFAGILVLLAFGSNSVSTALIRSLEQQYPAYRATAVEPAFICVMGGDWVGSDELPFTSQPDRSFLERLVEATRIAQLHETAQCIVSINSGSVTQQKQAFLEAWCVMHGLAPARVKLLEGARDSESEIKQMTKLVQGQLAVMVSSATHIPRVMQLCEMYGMNAVPAPCAHRVKAQTGQQAPLFLRIFPASPNLARSRAALHEYTGMAWLRLKQALAKVAQPAANAREPISVDR